MAVWRGRCGTEAVSGGSRSPHLSQSGRHSLVTLARLVGLSMLFRAADVASTDRV